MRSLLKNPKFMLIIFNLYRRKWHLISLKSPPMKVNRRKWLMKVRKKRQNKVLSLIRWKLLLSKRSKRNLKKMIQHQHIKMDNKLRERKVRNQNQLRLEDPNKKLKKINMQNWSRNNKKKGKECSNFRKRKKKGYKNKNWNRLREKPKRKRNNKRDLRNKRKKKKKKDRNN